MRCNTYRGGKWYYISHICYGCLTWELSFKWRTCF
nr:MAG TPA: Putative cell wall binding repeat [Caudoviricetes sp.]